jgi:hypothetical protein
MAHLTHFKIAKPSRVTLSVTVTQPGLNAQYQRTVSLGRIPSRSTKSDRSVEQIVFNHLGTPATLNPTAAKHTDRLTVDLPPGTYGTSTYYGYCAGRFRIALDSVKPLRITNQTLRLSTSKVSKDSLAGVLDLNTVVLRGSQAGKLTWRSTNPSIAKVNQRGLLTMRRWGKAKIVVTTSKGKTAMLTVTANKPPVG